MKDIENFKKMFIEESLETLEVSEDILINTEYSKIDLESVNTIFRSFHSIKGGAATFEFRSLVKLAHVSENLLGLVRDGKLELGQEQADLLLAAIDKLKADLLQAEHQVEMTEDLELIKSIEDCCVKKDEIDINSRAKHAWLIKFKPTHDLFSNDLDLQSAMTDLEKLGKITVKLDYKSLPDLTQLHDNTCYLAWNIAIINTSNPIADRDLQDAFALFAFETEKLEIIDNTVAEYSEKSDIVATDTKIEINKTHATSDETKTKPKVKAKEEVGSIRVNKNKIDTLLNIVGELVIVQSMLKQIGQSIELPNGQALKKGLDFLERNIRELRDSIMEIRMVPISVIFKLAPRTVYDVAKAAKKLVLLQVTGEGTELDKSVLEKITDPLTHLLRNAVDHGIESPEERIKLGKPENGLLKLSAYHRGSNIIVEITDDGKGLNLSEIERKGREKGLLLPDNRYSAEEIRNLIFAPGFSTAAVVSEISGRGVGLDVVKKNIQQIGGSIEIESEINKGTTFRIVLPLTLAIVEGQSVKIDGFIYIIPLEFMLESIQMEAVNISKIGSNSAFYLLRNEIIPIISLADVFYIKHSEQEIINKILVIVKHKNTKFGLLVDELLSQNQIVIKSLEDNYMKVRGISAATIMGDGTVSLIVDIADIYDIAISRNLLQIRNYENSICEEEKYDASS